MQPFIIQTKNGNLGLITCHMDNSLEHFFKRFGGDEIEGAFDNIFYIMATDAVFDIKKTAKGQELVLIDHDGNCYFSIELRFDSIHRENGVLLLTTPEWTDESVAKSILNYEDLEQVSTALFDLEIKNGWEAFTCEGLLFGFYDENFDYG